MNCNSMMVLLRSYRTSDLVVSFTHLNHQAPFYELHVGTSHHRYLQNTYLKQVFVAFTSIEIHIVAQDLQHK